MYICMYMCVCVYNLPMIRSGSNEGRGDKLTADDY